MWSLLQKLNTDVVKVIEIDDNSKVSDDNEDEGNTNGTNDGIIMQDQNKCDMEDVILNDDNMLSNEVLHIE